MADIPAGVGANADIRPQAAGGLPATGELSRSLDSGQALGDDLLMAKYDPLHAYLKRQRAPELQLTFREIENLLGRMLPRSAEQPQWWAERSDNTRRAVQVRAWAEAGYSAKLLVGADRVEFTRACS